MNFIMHVKPISDNVGPVWYRITLMRTKVVIATDTVPINYRSITVLLLININVALWLCNHPEGRHDRKLCLKFYKNLALLTTCVTIPMWTGWESTEGYPPPLYGNKSLMTISCCSLVSTGYRRSMTHWSKGQNLFWLSLTIVDLHDYLKLNNCQFEGRPTYIQGVASV